MLSHKQNGFQKLDDEETKNPYLVLQRFFDYAGIDSQRTHLWEFFKTMVSGTFNSQMLDRGKRYDIIYFYEHLEKLIEASYLINTMHPRTKKKQSRVRNS